MASKQLILICDDQHIIHETLGVYLKSEGFEYISAYDGDQAVDEFNKKKPNLIILDLMMPKRSGMDVCRTVRQTSNIPIIMLTAKSEEIDRVLGLELGADDYIVKPFSAREVVARVKAVLRRFNTQEEEPAQILKYGNLEININNYDVRIDGERLPLTPKEVEIFQLLASHPGKVFSREKILATVWGYDYYGDTRAVDTQIKRIRQKLVQRVERGWSIKTVYGVGYRFEVGEDIGSDMYSDYIAKE
ncbi:MAG: response regulator transcription factor [Clostridia bacterium]|nr:response regulator transcription factor [Clostridia bacterium]